MEANLNSKSIAALNQVEHLYLTGPAELYQILQGYMVTDIGANMLMLVKVLHLKGIVCCVLQGHCPDGTIKAIWDATPLNHHKQHGSF